MNVLTRKLRLAEITISGLKVETFVLSSHIVFETGLNEFRIDNPNDNTLYREIVSIEDGRAIQSLVKIFKNATEGVDTNQVDLEIRLKMRYQNSLSEQLCEGFAGVRQSLPDGQRSFHQSIIGCCYGCQRKHGESLRQSDSNLVRY